jgi:hypothetical protein
MAGQGLDANSDGVFSPEELKPLTDVNINFAEGVRLLHLRACRQCRRSSTERRRTPRSTTTRACSRSSSPCRSISRSMRITRKFRSTCTIRPSSLPSASPPRLR